MKSKDGEFLRSRDYETLFFRLCRKGWTLVWGAALERRTCWQILMNQFSNSSNNKVSTQLFKRRKRGLIHPFTIFYPTVKLDKLKVAILIFFLSSIEVTPSLRSKRGRVRSRKVRRAIIKTAVKYDAPVGRSCIIIGRRV